MTVENTNTATEAGLLFSYYIVLSFWAAQGLGMSLLSRNVAGQTKKSVAVTMNFVAWAAGNAIGKFFFSFSSLFSLFFSTSHSPPSYTQQNSTYTPNTPREREKILTSPLKLKLQVPKSSSPGIPLGTSSPSPLI